MRFSAKPILLLVACAAMLTLALQGLAAPKRWSVKSGGIWSLQDTATVIPVRNEAFNYVLELTSKLDPTWEYGVTGGGLRYIPTASLYFQDIYKLSTYWKAVTDWGGGSPRFYLAIDMDNDGDFEPHYANPESPDGYAFAYILQKFPAFYGGPTGWLDTGNLIGATTGIWDTTQFGGPSGYTNYAGALSLFSGKRVVEIQIVVDGGWLKGWSGSDFEQVVWANYVTVNSDVYVAR